MFKIWLTDINKIADPVLYSNIGMEGELNGSTLRCNDGRRYNKVNSNKSKTKLYFQCYKRRSGCCAKVHTKYADKDEDRLQVIYSNGNHNHPVYFSCIGGGYL